ncbi:MAG: MBL fold metallo-hydrolase [Myxococcota bacterium]|nr:MBL fold metallo-hydrolase [Myxococcota bacterium]
MSARAVMTKWLVRAFVFFGLSVALSACPDTTLPSLSEGRARVCDAEELSAFRAASTESERSDLWIAFVDVGQGDAAWIRTPGIRELDAKEILIDSGNCRFVDKSCGLQGAGGIDDSYDSNGVGALIDFMSESGWPPGSPIDLIVATHQDKDHFGGSWRLLQEYIVRAFLDPGGENDQRTWLAVLSEVQQQGLTHRSPAELEGIDLFEEGALSTESWGRNVKVSLLSADASASEDNDRSVVLLLESLGNRVLFTGDAEERLDARVIAARPEGLTVDVLKAGHHGGRGTSSEALLDWVFPPQEGRGFARYAVLSSGGREGLPDEDVVERLRDRVGDFGFYRTDRYDEGRGMSETPGDDHILLRIRADGELTLCYAYAD